MPQNEVIPAQWSIVLKDEYEHAGENLLLKLTTHDLDARFSFEQVAEDVYRTTFTSPKHPLPPWPSIACTRLSTRRPAQDTILDTFFFTTASSFACVKVDWKDGPPIVSIALKDCTDKIIHRDLAHRSYVLDGPGVAHYTQYNRQALHVGLGEKAAPMDLSKRHFVLSATDCFGYDAHHTDPMYKHIPLLMTATPEYAVATFSTSHSRGVYAVGSEIDGMWGRYKVYRQDYGGLEEYVIVGRTMQDVLRKYADLVGYPLLVPRWAFGYLAGGMKYSMLDEPRACDALVGFANKLREHDIPCSGFQLSSGYTVAETEPKTRNVFTWNKHRFPDPKGFVDNYLRRGIRLIANVKPYVLASHPEYEKLKAAEAFFTDPRTGESAQARLWSAGGGESGVGGHIDFTSRAGYDFWYNGVKALREMGIACIWNDNNEYTIPDDQWQCALDPSIMPSESVSAASTKDVGLWGRYTHTEIMGKASHDAVLSTHPHERPFILTRAATAGTLRYCASSWSGDNVTSWSSMKGANAISLTASTCLLHTYGHDIGGFEGPEPSPELLLRWVQLGCHSMRFAINCFKTSEGDNNVGDVIEPWMYPEITPLIRDAIRRRYEMIPYLYSLMLRSHLYAEPPVRWTGWDYPGDGQVWTDQVLRDGETQYFLGGALLVGGVYEPGVDAARVYLPSRSGPAEDMFLNLNAPHEYLPAGQWHTISSPWKGSIPILAKAGTLIPIGHPFRTVPSHRAAQHEPADLPLDDYRAVELFPPPPSSSQLSPFKNSWLEDDGISPAPSGIVEFELVYEAHPESADVISFKQRTVRDDGSGRMYEPLWQELHFIMPVGETRFVSLKGQAMEKCEPDAKGRMVYRSSVEALKVA